MIHLGEWEIYFWEMEIEMVFLLFVCSVFFEVGAKQTLIYQTEKSFIKRIAN